MACIARLRARALCRCNAAAVTVISQEYVFSRKRHANALHRVFIKRKIDGGYNFCHPVNNDVYTPGVCIL